MVHMPDALDEGLNLIGENAQKNGAPKSVLRKLKNLFCLSGKKKFIHHEIKQAFILMEMGDFFRGNGNRAQAKVNYEAALLLLEKEPGHALAHVLAGKLEQLERSQGR
jgi:hypothetical protein